MFYKHRSQNKITAEHLERIAYVYIRQSTFLQVRENTASKERQYDLVQRAYDLGWTRERIQAIDEDQAHSGTTSADRSGFQKLVLDVSLGRVGAILCLEVHRMARCCADWYRLLELCALSNCIVIDEDGIYDVNDFNDRLILGMKGNISEYELHFLKSRLLGGKIKKAEQAQLRMRLPIGYVYDGDGKVIFDPDEQVQQAVRMAFNGFDQMGSAHAVVKYFRENNLLFPARFYGGQRDGQILWRPLNHVSMIRLLHNPAYAGAYVFGRTRTNPKNVLTAASPRRPRRGVPLEQWPIWHKDIYPAYISWAQFLQNQKRLDQNRMSHQAECPGAVREGPSLMQGITLCGLCGRRMFVQYKGHDRPHYYVCRDTALAGKICQTISGRPVDQAISQAFLQAITPAQISISLQTMEQIEKQALAVEHHWQLRLERARYEAERARRQYDQSEPENRLVVRQLERAWEEKLRELERLQQDYDTHPRPKLLTLTEEERNKIVDITKDLPGIWNAPTTTHQERKQLLRLLIGDMTLKKDTSTIQIGVRWQTDAVTWLEIERPAPAWQTRKSKPELIRQIGRLAKKHTDRQIADRLNQEGIRSATGKSFTSSMIQSIRRSYNIRTTCPAVGAEHLERRGDGRYSTRGAAKKLNVTVWTVANWCKKGKLDGKQDVPNGPWWIKLNEKIIKEPSRPISGKAHRTSS